MQGYADDQVTMVKGKNESILCELMVRALDLVWSWCRIWSQHKCWQDDHSAAPFTRRTKFKLDLLVLGRTVNDYVKEVKEDYLGIILHQKLSVLGLHR